MPFAHSVMRSLVSSGSETSPALAWMPPAPRREIYQALGLRITVGRGVVEARPPIRADKGTAVRALVEEYGPEKAMFVGDDTTDLDAFRELEKLREEGTLKEILRVGVTSEEGPPEITSEADIVVDGVDGVDEVLQALLGESE